jgi:hypothetical protein
MQFRARGISGIFPDGSGSRIWSVLAFGMNHFLILDRLVGYRKAWPERRVGTLFANVGRGQRIRSTFGVHAEARARLSDDALWIDASLRFFFDSFGREWR